MLSFRTVAAAVLVLALPIFGHAQEMGPNNQKLGDKWLTSYDAIPEHLQSRFEGEEVLYNGNIVEEDIAGEILAADEMKPTQKISEIVNKTAFANLQRQMKSEHLADLIKSGVIEPRTYKVGSEEEVSLIGVYLELHTKELHQPFQWADVELQFDYSVLDRSDYIINPYWNFGSYGPLTASAELNLGRVAYYVSSYLTKADQNEIVFLNAIPFSAVTKIRVQTKKIRDAIMKQIKTRKLTCPQAGGCEALITTP